MPRPASALRPIGPRQKQCSRCWTVLPIEAEYCCLCETPRCLAILPVEVDVEDSLPGPRRPMVDEGGAEYDPLNEDDGAYAAGGSTWLRNEELRREAEEARQASYEDAG